MISYLLDTDIVSYLMKRRHLALQTRFLQAPPESWAISAITYAELLFGLESFDSSHPARDRAISFLAAAQILDWPSDAAAPYAMLRHRLRKQPIGDRDMMIAAHALALNTTLITNNVRHFSRIGSPLRIDNWAE